MKIGNQWYVLFLKTNWWTHVLLWGHWYPCFGLLVTSPLGSKVRVGSLIHTWQRIHDVGSLRFTSGVTPADHLMASMATGHCSPLACSQESPSITDYRTYHSATSNQINDTNFKTTFLNTSDCLFVHSTIILTYIVEVFASLINSWRDQLSK